MKTTATPPLRGILLLSAVLVLSPFAQATDMIWGICGHSGRVSTAYGGLTQVSYATQLQLVKDLGATHYRLDAAEADDPFINDMVAAIRANPDFHGPDYKIKLLPILYKPASAIFTTSTPEQIRQACYNRALSFVAAHKADFNSGIMTEIEIENEMADSYGALISGRNGDVIADYDSAKYAKIKAIVRGFCQGIWDGNTQNQTAFKRVVGDTWLHYGYLDQIILDAQVEGWSYCLWHITAWHWYSNMNSANRIIAKLNGYGKPIWINEVNDGGGSLAKTTDAQGNVTANPADYIRQSAHLKALVREVANLKGVAAIFPYELLDRKTQSVAATNPASVTSYDYYGLYQVKYNGTNLYVDATCPKPSFTDYQAMIADSSLQTVKDGTALLLDDSYFPGAVDYFPSAADWPASVLQKQLYDTARHDNAIKSPARYVRYRPYIPASGYYQVALAYPSNSTRSFNTKVTIYRGGQSHIYYVDQRSGSSTAQTVQWLTLPGTYYFNAGWTSDYSQYVELSNTGTAANTYVMADGVRLIRQ